MSRKHKAQSILNADTCTTDAIIRNKIRLCRKEKGHVVFGYCRVSTSSQDCEQQAQAMRDSCSCDIIFQEQESVEGPQKALQRLISFAEKNDQVYVQNLDRFGRDLIKVVETIYSPLRKKGVYVASPDKVYCLDRTSDLLILVMLGCVAHVDRDNIKVRTERGKRAWKQSPQYIASRNIRINAALDIQTEYDKIQKENPNMSQRSIAEYMNKPLSSLRYSLRLAEDMKNCGHETDED